MVVGNKGSREKKKKGRKVGRHPSSLLKQKDEQNPAGPHREQLHLPGGVGKQPVTLSWVLRNAWELSRTCGLADTHQAKKQERQLGWKAWHAKA